MKKPHRRAHVLIWLALLPVVLAGVFLALQLRVETPYNDPSVIDTLTEGTR